MPVSPLTLLPLRAPPATASGAGALARGSGPVAHPQNPPASESGLAGLTDSSLFAKFAAEDPRYAQAVFDLTGGDTAESFVNKVEGLIKPSLWRDWRDWREGDEIENGVLVGVFGSVAGGVVGGVAGGMFGGMAGGMSGGIAGLGTAFSAAFAVALSNPVLGIGGVLASLGLGVFISVVGNVAGPLQRALPKHKEALRAYEDAQKTAGALRAHLEDADGIQEKLAENPQLYLNFLKTLLAENAKRKEEFEQAKGGLLEILKEHEGRLAGLDSKCHDNPTLKAELALAHGEKRAKAVEQLEKTRENLALCEKERAILEWEIQTVAAIIERLGRQRSEIEKEVQYLAEAGAHIDYVGYLNRRARMEILAVLRASKEIMSEILARFQAGQEVRQITVSLDLSEDLDRRREEILAERSPDGVPG